MSKLNNKDKVLIFISIFLFISCTRESNTNGITIHPVPEKMPYSSIEPEMLHVHDGGEVIDLFPESLQLLYSVINDDTEGLYHTEPILLASGVNDTLLTTGNIDVSSVNDSSLLILDRSTNRLIQYNINENKYDVIADQGRGPGDLYFSRELSVNGNVAFIGMQAFEISKFVCNSGLCEYAKTIQTDYNNYSVAPDTDHIYFLGISAFGREQDPDPANTDQYLIHKINYDGEVQQSFLPIYRHKSPMVRDAMNSGGRVRLFPESDTIVVTFSRAPYLYVHDSEGKLTAKYELPEYLQFYFESKEDRAGRISTHYKYAGNYSSIFYTSKLNERWLLLKTREDRNRVYHEMEERYSGTQWYSYYAFDVSEEKLYKIGEDFKKPVGEERRVLHVIDQGLIINENGLLYLLLNKT